MARAFCAIFMNTPLLIFKACFPIAYNPHTSAKTGLKGSKKNTMERVATETCRRAAKRPSEVQTAFIFRQGR